MLAFSQRCVAREAVSVTRRPALIQWPRNRRMGSILVQDQAWPLVVTTFPSGELTDSDVHDYIGQLAAVLGRGELYGIITDATAGVASMRARHHGLIDAWLKANADALGRLSCGNAIIVRPSPLLRGVLNALYRFKRPPNPHRVFGSFEDGADWVLDRLVSARVLTQAEASERRRIAARLAAPPVDREERSQSAARDARSPGQIGPVIDMFSEPAFLLTSKGEVVHANPAATQTFPVTPSWLPTSVSTADTPLKELCQVTRVEVVDGFLYLVVPNAELVSPPEMDPRLEVELPPSLDRIARLLARGLCDKDIAAETDQSLATVRTYVTRVFKRMDVHSRAELICLWNARERWAARAP